VFHLDRLRRGWPGDQELAVRRSHQEEVNAPAVDSNRHPQLYSARQELVRASVSEHGPHTYDRLDGTLFVVGVWEEEEQRIAPKLEEAAALVVRDPEHPGKHVVQDLGERLCADPSTASQPFREGREAGQVDKAE
jgi:hypothetical protein